MKLPICPIKIDISRLLFSRRPQPTPSKQRPTKYWSEQYPETCGKITRQEIKLQEAIFELSHGEEDLVQDMNLLRKTYAESMVTFKILSQAEADLVFGKLYPIIPLHNSLCCALASLRYRRLSISVQDIYINSIGRFQSKRFRIEQTDWKGCYSLGKFAHVSLRRVLCQLDQYQGIYRLSPRYGQGF